VSPHLSCGRSACTSIHQCAAVVDRPFAETGPPAGQAIGLPGNQEGSWPALPVPLRGSRRAWSENPLSRPGRPWPLGSRSTSPPGPREALVQQPGSDQLVEDESVALNTPGAASHSWTDRELRPGASRRHFGFGLGLEAEEHVFGPPNRRMARRPVRCATRR